MQEVEMKDINGRIEKLRVHDVEIVGGFQTAVLARCDQDEIFVFMVELLPFGGAVMSKAND